MQEAPGQCAEEVAADCPYINEYCETRHRGVVRCAWSAEKGRVLLSRAAFSQGEIVFREPPLHIVAEQPDSPVFARLKQLTERRSKVFGYEPLWYFCAVSSLTQSQLVGACAPSADLVPIAEDSQRKLLLLYHEPVRQASEAVRVLIQELGLPKDLDPLLIERLLQVWIQNCFEHSESPLGYSSYFMSSFMSHSCLPNAVWHYDGDDFILRARANIEVGDEISVSYLSEDALLESAVSRRKQLKESKRFFCNCARCDGLADRSRGFRCPRCARDVFPRPGGLPQAPPSGGGVVGGTRVAAESLAAAVSADAAVWSGVACETCAVPVADEQARKLLSEEHWLEAQCRGLERSMDKSRRSRQTECMAPLEEAIKRAETSLGQHWLLDVARGMLVDVYARNGRKQEAVATLRARISFQERAYPHLSGTRAWTLEGYADLLVRQLGGAVEPQIRIPPDRVAEAGEALQVYNESSAMLRQIFGDSHEYYTAVQRKATELAVHLSSQSL